MSNDPIASDKSDILSDIPMEASDLAFENLGYLLLFADVSVKSDNIDTFDDALCSLSCGRAEDPVLSIDALDFWEATRDLGGGIPTRTLI